MDFHNSVVLITGGASGIGEATTRYFVSLGAYVVVADQDTERGQKLAEEYRGKIDFYQADVGSEDQVKSLFDFIRQKHGVLDVLHNNAAYSLSKTLWDTTAEEWNKVMYVNLRGYFLCAKYALDLLKKCRHGAIVCTASELGVVGCVESLAYNTSKGGVLQFVKSLALELAEFGIRVNAVCPAGTVTPAFVRDMSRTGDYDRECRELVAEYPLGRLGMPDDIAKAVAFLASEDASFITGTHLMVDGGFTAH